MVLKYSNGRLGKEQRKRKDYSAWRYQERLQGRGVINKADLQG